MTLISLRRHTFGSSAADHDRRGIEGECGGFLNCATYHVFVDAS